MVLSAESLEDLNKLISDKYEKLGNNFPNYDLLNQIYTEFMAAKQQEFNERTDNLLSKFKYDIQRENWFAFDHEVLKAKRKYKNIYKI